MCDMTNELNDSPQAPSATLSTTVSKDAVSKHAGRRSTAFPPYSEPKRVRYNNVIVSPTLSRGLGVFARTRISARYAVGRVVGEIKPRDYRSQYCVEFGDSDLEPNEPFRFLNHSCEHNCELIEWNIGYGGQTFLELWVHALRDIEQGEELTIDYAWDWQEAIPCLCGSKKCRGWICKEDELEQCRRYHAQIEKERTSDYRKRRFHYLVGDME